MQPLRVVEESSEMAFMSPDLTYVSRPMEPDAAQWTTPAPIVYQTPRTGANQRTLTPSLKTERVVKLEQTPKLPRKDRRASPYPRSSSKEQHCSRTRQDTGHDDDCNGESATARRRTAQSTRSTERRRARSKSTTSRELRGRLRWDDLNYTATKGSSSENKRKSPLSRTSSRSSLSNRIPQSLQRAESSFSSLSESSIHEHTKPKHILKPPKYDGTGSFETFLAQFQNCALYNKWTKKEQIVYLRSSLEKDANQVLWDYSAETTALLSRMIRTLKERFGEANQSDKYRFELKNRRRRPNETLRNLHSDIRRLAALALSELEHRARETMA